MDKLIQEQLEALHALMSTGRVDLVEMVHKPTGRIAYLICYAKATEGGTHLFPIASLFDNSTLEEYEASEGMEIVNTKKADTEPDTGWNTLPPMKA